MKQQIENIIKKNLPKIQEHICGFNDGECVCNCFQEALSQINPSKIADEVLKVVVENIKEEINKIKVFEVETNFEDGGDSEYADRRIAVDNSRRRGQSEMQSKVLQLLSTLSPNKENKNTK